MRYPRNLPLVRPAQAKSLRRMSGNHSQADREIIGSYTDRELVEGSRVAVAEAGGVPGQRIPVPGLGVTVSIPLGACCRAHGRPNN
jgi:hypothetical protein